MTYKDLDLPVPYRETFDVLDASKTKTFLMSPRAFFFEHILGWRSDAPNIHLVFGSAWHEAMEYMMQHVGEYKDPAVISTAWQLFNTLYEEQLSLIEVEHKAKTPDNALAALIDYAKYYSTIDKFKTLHTEIAGTVHISPARVVHFKLDSIIQDKDGVRSMEHKTASRSSQSWVDQWQVSVQTLIYEHALRGLYNDKARGCVINGAILRAPRRDGTSNNDFLRIPVHRTNDLMLSGIQNLNHFVDQLDWNMIALAETKISDRTMRAFPCNGQGCQLYNGCSWASYCASWPNPLQQAENPPIGINIEHWDPRGMEKKAKKVVHIDE